MCNQLQTNFARLTWTEVVEQDCQTRKLNKENATDHSRWGKLIKDGC